MHSLIWDDMTCRKLSGFVKGVLASEQSPAEQRPAFGSCCPVCCQELLEDSYFLLQMPCVLPEMSKPDSWPKNNQAGILGHGRQLTVRGRRALPRGRGCGISWIRQLAIRGRQSGCMMSQVQPSPACQMASWESFVFTSLQLTGGKA